MRFGLRALIAALLMAAGLSGPVWAGVVGPVTTNAPAPAGAVTGPAATVQGGTQSAGAIANHVAGVMASLGGSGAIAGLDDPITGMASGGAPATMNGWLAGSGTHLKKTDAGGQYGGNIFTQLVGADTAIGDRWRVGAAVGSEQVGLETAYNTGHVDGRGATLAPYAAYRLSPAVSVSTALGLSHHWYDIRRSGNSISGSTEGDRLFHSIEMQDSRSYGAWQVTGALGHLYIYERQSSYLEKGGSSVGVNQSRLGEGRLTGKLGYQVPLSWGQVVPYATARGEYDYSRTPGAALNSTSTAAASRMGVFFGGGVNMAINDAILVDLNAGTMQFRDNFESYTLGASLRVKF